MSDKLIERINQYTEHLQYLSFEQHYCWKANYEELQNKSEDELLDFTIKTYEEDYFELQDNPKFIRIVRKDKYSNGGSAHAFVEKSTGKLVKTASWKSPAKKSNGELQSKYNLLDDDSFELLIEQADIYGGHLYVR